MEVLDWAIKMLGHIAFMVKALLYEVLEPRHSLGLAAIMKLKADVVDKMEVLIQDSLQC
jgi:hypothetical protein